MKTNYETLVEYGVPESELNKVIDSGIEHNLHRKNFAIFPNVALVLSFTWDETPQRDQFWRNIYRELHNEIFDKNKKSISHSV